MADSVSLPSLSIYWKRLLHSAAITSGLQFHRYSVIIRGCLHWIRTSLHYTEHVCTVHMIVYILYNDHPSQPAIVWSSLRLAVYPNMYLHIFCKEYYAFNVLYTCRISLNSSRPWIVSASSWLKKTPSLNSPRTVCVHNNCMNVGGSTCHGSLHLNSASVCSDTCWNHSFCDHTITQLLRY